MLKFDLENRDHDQYWGREDKTETKYGINGFHILQPFLVYWNTPGVFVKCNQTPRFRNKGLINDVSSLKCLLHLVIEPDLSGR